MTNHPPKRHDIAVFQDPINPRYTATTTVTNFGRSVAAGHISATRMSRDVVTWKGGPDRRSPERVLSVTADDQALLSRALTGDHVSVNQLVNRFTPIVQTRVGRKLMSTASQRDLRQDVKDYTQDVFLHVFQKQGKILRDWEPERGMSLDNYIGLVAERRTISLLRSGKRNPWREREALDEVHEPASKNADLESSAVQEDTLNTLLSRLRESLSPLGWRLFELLYIKEQTVTEVKLQLNLSSDAVYAWRSRLRKTAIKCQEELNAEMTAETTIGHDS